MRGAFSSISCQSKDPQQIMFNNLSLLSQWQQLNDTTSTTTPSRHHHFQLSLSLSLSLSRNSCFHMSEYLYSAAVMNLTSATHHWTVVRVKSTPFKLTSYNGKLLVYIHSLNSGICIVPFQGGYSEALPTPAWPNKTTLSLKKNARVRVLGQRLSTFWDPRTASKFCLSVADHHWKLWHGKFPKLIYLCVHIIKKQKSSLCSRTARQMAADHYWSTDHRLRTVVLGSKHSAKEAAPNWGANHQEGTFLQGEGASKRKIEKILLSWTEGAGAPST